MFNYVRMQLQLLHDIASRTTFITEFRILICPISHFTCTHEKKTLYSFLVTIPFRRMFPRKMQHCKFRRYSPGRNGWAIEPRNKRKLFCRCKLAGGGGCWENARDKRLSECNSITGSSQCPKHYCPVFPLSIPIPLSPERSSTDFTLTLSPAYRRWFVITLYPPRHNGVKQEITKLILWVCPRVHRGDDNFVNVA